MKKGIQILFTLAALLTLAQRVANQSTPFNPGDTLSNCINVVPVPQSCGPFSSQSGFRTIDGTCNNKVRRTQGAANTPLARLITANYADTANLDTPRGFPGTAPSVPTPHQVAGAVFSAQVVNRQTSTLTAMYMALGQIIDHDVGLTFHPSCDVSSGCGSNTAFTYPCFPIQFEQGGSSCTPFARSIPVCQPNAPPRTTRQQINVLTSYLDLSQVYSSEFAKHLTLRGLDGTGFMKLTSSQLLEVKLPATNPNCDIPGGCSLVGDERGDENIALHSLHTIFVRNHNYVAGKLKNLAGTWTDDLLFDTARKINIAIYQRIVYEEFLPHLVDVTNYRKYDKNVDASIVNVFSTAAFRFGHSLIPNAWAQLNNNFDEAFADISLQASFFDTSSIRTRGIEPTAYGLLANQSQVIDTQFAFGVARRLFVPVGEIRHEDLTALNIQRGRDHGLATYGAWRSFCNLPVLTSFSDLNGVMPADVITELQNVYSNPNDIDIFAAGIAEIHTNGKMLGPTFQCILKTQFERLRDGDRFYYERNGVFTTPQIRELRKMTMARMLCNTLVGIVSIQSKALEAATSGNTRRECGGIADMDFTVFAR